jgi:hypothetical protein
VQKITVPLGVYRYANGTEPHEVTIEIDPAKLAADITKASQNKRGRRVGFGGAVVICATPIKEG